MLMAIQPALPPEADPGSSRWLAVGWELGQRANLLQQNAPWPPLKYHFRETYLFWAALTGMWHPALFLEVYPTESTAPAGSTPGTCPQPADAAGAPVPRRSRLSRDGAVCYECQLGLGGAATVAHLPCPHAGDAAAWHSGGAEHTRATRSAHFQGDHGLLRRHTSAGTMKLAALVLLGLCAVGALAKTQGEARRRQPEHPTALTSRPSIAVAAREAGGGRSPAEHPHQRHPRTAPRPRARHPPPSWAAQWHWAALAGPTATAASGPGSASPPAHRRPPLRRRLGPPQPNPIAPGPIPAAGICETYVVAPGDSVVSIAAKFSVSQSECGGVLVAAAAACLRIPPATQIWPHRSCRNVAGWMSRIVACNDGQAGGMQHSSARLWAG